ncbi:hypothetical protein CCP1ISM_2260001 [Azospirillaceae bacterium]
MDDELKVMLGQILTVVEATREDVSGLKSEVASLKEDHGRRLDRIDACLDRLEERQERVESGLEQVRHVTSANHLKLSGKVELVANMLADHIADYHGPADRRRA